VGHSGDPSLVAGVGIGNNYINIVAIITLNGFNSALSTLVS
jgi:Na+-driven multidrug efflux pump